MNAFTWDIPKAIANFEKHGVPFEEAATVFGDANSLDGDDAEHSTQERRRQRIGQSVAGRIPFVIEQDPEKVRQQRSRIVQTLYVPQRVRLGPSLAAALLDSLFENPAGVFSCCAHVRTIEVLACQHSFSEACYTIRRTRDEKETIRIISARQASQREREAYARLPD